MKKGDKILLSLIGILFLISFLFYSYNRIYKKDNNLTAVIKQNNKIIKRISLNKVDKNEKFKVFYNKKDFNTIELQKGKIRFCDANCHDKICVKSGWLSKSGDIAVCLPHRLSIKIEGNNQEVDDVSY